MKVLMDYEVFKQATDLARGFLDLKENHYLQTHSTKELINNADYQELLSIHASILASVFAAIKQDIVTTDLGPAINGYVSKEQVGKISDY